MKRLIMRSDDVGYTAVANIGTFKVIDADVITNADVMLDCPGTEDALLKLKERPWVSVGWHCHDWGRPVTPAALIRNNIGEDGFLKWKVRAVQDFLSGKCEAEKNRASYDEALLEYRNQVVRCIRIYGAPPVSTSFQSTDNPVDAARLQVCREFGIAWNWFTKGPSPHSPGVPCNPEYEHLGVFMPWQGNGTNKFMAAFSSDGQERYDPIRGFLSDGDGIMNKETVQVAFHPAFLDDYILYDGSLNARMPLVRVMDVYHLCRQEFKDWIIENKIALVSAKDAIYGTNEFQKHLFETGSPLWMGNF